MKDLKPVQLHHGDKVLLREAITNKICELANFASPEVKAAAEDSYNYAIKEIQRYRNLRARLE
jgi:hypothetical protein